MYLLSQITMYPEEIMAPACTCLDAYLASLAVAATPDQSTIARLIEANNQLTEANTCLTENLTALTAAYNKLITAMPRTAIPAAPSVATTAPAPANAHQHPAGAHNSYCWMHGYRIGPGHSSATCRSPAAGHQPRATRNNMMHGSTAGKPPAS